ncbi:exopolysaccharide biosynthesis polyprenyl glycosylphosphotransferase [Pelagicoccus mobilis]|uniref:Exopolysaccharide biosynthesis polyprenyl glycosylphosphotransferase n=2 Tax=Pelagicoccus mobilis TaxID=415221 RepID=A0A934RZU8_9BACT|nr:exopolysaccharide biosynthesis polyprenyl glycosylphosphotransferase [Pelagicoccus mobilis]
MVIAYVLRYVLNIGVVNDVPPRPGVIEYFIHYSAGFVLFFLLAMNLKLYDSNVTASVERSTMRLVNVSLFWAIMFLGSSLILKLSPPISRLFVGYSCALMCGLLPAWRIAYLRAAKRVGFDKNLVKRVLLVGCSPEHTELVERLTSNASGTYEVVGVVTTTECAEASCRDLPIVGSLDRLDETLAELEVDAITVADLELSYDAILGIAKVCERRFVEFTLVPGEFEVFSQCLGLRMIGSQPVLGIAELPQNRIFSRIVKRVVDLVGSMVGLLITAPITPIVAFFIWKESPGPIIYRQTRMGKGGKLFTIYKFRSMKLASESDGKARWCKRDDPRRLKCGAFLRKWNIDELPQFWNVLKGDMSLVGPRPERPELIVDFLDKIPHYQSRHSVRPGMTGWAQVNGLRGDTSLEDRIQHDLQYIENWSLSLDITIQVRTLFQYKNAY